jgi:hypothetical protein
MTATPSVHEKLKVDVMIEQTVDRVRMKEGRQKDFNGKSTR